MCNCNRPVCNECQQAKPMATPHKHAAVIKAWAEGAKIEYRYTAGNEWFDIGPYTPAWHAEAMDYRVKPTPKPLGEVAKEAWYYYISNHKFKSGDDWQHVADAVVAAYKEQQK